MSKSNVQLVYSAVFLVMLFHIKFCLSEEKIIGGQVCTSVKHDFVVAILAKENLGKMHICTGSLLNAKWVLTAAHCCTRMTGFVMAGVSIHSVKAQLALGSTKDVTITTIDECIMHEDWDPKRTVNDISLLKLVGEILEGPTVSYVKLPDAKLEDDIDETIAAGVSMGWGLTNVTANQSADVLQCLSLNVLPASKCINTFQTKHDPDTIVCVFNRGKSLFHGDSGGPFVSNGVQYGVTSMGHSTQPTENPAVLTRVDAFLEFIRSETSGSKRYVAAGPSALILLVILWTVIPPRLW